MAVAAPRKTRRNLAVLLQTTAGSTGTPYACYVMSRSLSTVYHSLTTVSKCLEYDSVIISRMCALYVCCLWKQFMSYTYLNSYDMLWVAGCSELPDVVSSWCSAQSLLSALYRVATINAAIYSICHIWDKLARRILDVLPMVCISVLNYNCIFWNGKILIKGVEVRSIYYRNNRAVNIGHI
jgi:hypothetical protein